MGRLEGMALRGAEVGWQARCVETVLEMKGTGGASRTGSFNGGPASNGIR